MKLRLLFTDDDIKHVRCDRYAVRDGVLTTWYEGTGSTAGMRMDVENYPLVNLYSFHEVSS